MDLCASLFFDHQIRFEVHFPIQNDAYVKQRIFLDLKRGGKSMFMPAENNAGSDGFDIHGGGFDDAAVIRGIFDHFLVEHFVLAPAGDGVKLVKMIRINLHMKIALNKLGIVTILRVRFKIFANEKLKKLDMVVWHALILINPFCDCKGGTDRRGDRRGDKNSRFLIPGLRNFLEKRGLKAYNDLQQVEGSEVEPIV